MKNILAIIIFSFTLAACGNDTESIETTNMSDLNSTLKEIGTRNEPCDFLTESLLKSTFPSASEIKRVSEDMGCYYTFKTGDIEHGLSLMLHAVNDPNYKEVFKTRVLPIISGSEEQLDNIGEKAYYTSKNGELIVVGNQSVMQMTLSGATGDKPKEMVIKLANALLSEFTK